MSGLAAQGLTGRQKREQAFYDRYVEQFSDLSVDFSPITSGEDRPYNAYWYAYRLAAQRLAPQRDKLLDFGCGRGINTVRLARMGYDCSGFDISPNNIDFAGRLAEHHGLADRVHLRVMAAEQLDYPDAVFDVVFGCDILHHVEVARAFREAWRVLKPGGWMIFREPVRVPLIDSLRETRLVRALVPNHSTTDVRHHITEDERKLTAGELRTVTGGLEQVQVKRFSLLARLHHPLRCRQGLLQKIDHHLLRLPGLGRLGDVVVLAGRKPVGAAACRCCGVPMRKAG